MHSEEYYKQRQLWTEYLTNATHQEVNQEHYGQTHFELVYEYQLYEILYVVGYEQQESDLEFLKRKWSASQTPEQKEVWLSARVAYKLNDALKIEKAYKKMRILCVIFSIQQKEIIGYRFQNFLALINNALEMHKSHAELVLKALKRYKMYDFLQSIDYKNTFSAKEQRLKQTKPLQDKDLETIIYELFPELQ